MEPIRPQACRRAALVGVTLLVAGGGLAGCVRHSDPVAALVPRAWTLTAKSGHIAHVCFGSWEECGTLTDTFRTDTSMTDAADAIRHQLQSKGWTIDDADPSGSQLSARDAQSLEKETARIDVTIGNNTATVRYVHN